MRLMDPPGGRPWALIGLCGASLLLNVVLTTKIVRQPPATPAPVAMATVAQAADAPAAPTLDAPVEGSVDPSATPAPQREAERIDAEDEPLLDELKVVRATVQHSLARTFQRAIPEHGDMVSAVFARLFFWDLNLRRDLQAGDELELAYEWEGDFPEIAVATFRSGSLGRTLRAYRFQATGDTYPSWWDDEGREVSKRLVDGPLEDYEQVTSLLRDRPGHRGMDFKVPIGAPIQSPRPATVVRTNWNLRFNGNCVELRYNDGTLARFLHLSDVQVQPGQSVSAGQVIGETGNTGRSTGPHLHYELERNNRIVDPVDYHGTIRRTLPNADRTAFDHKRRRLDALLGGAS